MNNTKVNNYQIVKEKARQKAIDWQNDFANHSYYWSELAEWTHYYSFGECTWYSVDYVED